MLLLMVPSERRPVELTASPVESMATLILRVLSESTLTHLACLALEMRKKVGTIFRVLMVTLALLLQLQLLPLLKPQLLQPSLLILSLCSLLLDNSNPSLLQMLDQFKLHSILMLSR